MSILQNLVDSTAVNYETPFLYTIGVGLSEFTEEIQWAKLITFIPDGISFTMSSPNAYPAIETITTEDVTGGKNVIFTFNAIPYEGVSVQLYIQCRFDFPSIISSFTCNSQLFVNQMTTPVAQSSAETVSLVLTPDFRVNKTLYIPSVNPTPGGYLIWKLTLTNYGDAGAPISNVSITDNMPDYVTLHPLWPIYGSDQSDNRFADPEFNQRPAVSISTDLKSFTFTLPGNYTGTNYEIIVIGNIDAAAELNSYTSNIIWQATQKPTTTVGYSLTLTDPIYQLVLNTDVPSYAKQGNLYSASLYLENTGNSSVTNSLYAMDIPPEITPYQFNTGVWGIPDVSFIPTIEYSIDFVYTNASLQTQTQTIGGCYTNINRIISISELTIPDGYSLTNIQNVMPLIVPGLRAIVWPGTYGTVNTTANSTVQYHAQVTGTNGTEPFQLIANAETIINDAVTLVLTKQQQTVDFSNSGILKGDTIRYIGNISCTKSYVYQPILVDYLPPQVNYIGNERYIYYDAFNDVTYDSADTNVTFPLPVLHPQVETLANGHNIVRFSYTGANSYDLRQKDTLQIQFDVVVTAGDTLPLSIENFMFLGNYGVNGVVGPNMQNYLDNILDMDGDTFYPENLVQSNTVTIDILTVSSLNAQTQIKGSQNASFIEGNLPISSRSGANVTYRLLLTNIGDRDLYNIEIIDILPYVGDTSILTPTISRGSQFDIGYVSYTLTVTPVGNESVPTFTPYYCTGTNPIRFNQDLESIGTDTWSSSAAGTIKSLKFTQNNIPFKAGQLITLDIVASTPIDTNPELMAYNSFAISSSYIRRDAVTIYNRPIEPYKKGVRGIGSRSIYGVTFLDLLKTGIWNDADPGLNGIYISLNDATGEMITDTLSYNKDGLDGYYEFTDLAPGTYYLIFTINKRSQQFTTQVLTSPYGSQPNEFGITPALIITTDSPEVIVYAGIIDNSVQNILKANESARSMVKNAIYSNMLSDLQLEDVIRLP